MLARSVPLVRLTRPDGQPVLINIDQVTVISSALDTGYDGVTVFHFGAAGQGVLETFEEIAALLGIT